MFVDVHAHLESGDFAGDIEKVVKRSKEAGLVAIINNGVSIRSNRKTIELSKKYPLIKPALGLFPDEALKLSDEELFEELAFILKAKPFAIGEIGLDYYRVGEKEKQKKIFSKFIELAEKLNKPIIVHSRGAEKDVVDILEGTKLKVILHCFQGTQELIKRAEDNDWLFSIPPIILRDMGFQNLVHQVSISNLLTETDSPYLAPPPKKRNEPMNVVKVVEKISEIKNLNFDEVKKIIFMNYQRIFS